MLYLRKKINETVRDNGEDLRRRTEQAYTSTRE